MVPLSSSLSASVEPSLTNEPKTSSLRSLPLLGGDTSKRVTDLTPSEVTSKSSSSSTSVQRPNFQMSFVSTIQDACSKLSLGKSTVHILWTQFLTTPAEHRVTSRSRVVSRTRSYRVDWLRSEYVASNGVSARDCRTWGIRPREVGVHTNVRGPRRNFFTRRTLSEFRDKWEPVSTPTTPLVACSQPAGSDTVSASVQGITTNTYGRKGRVDTATGPAIVNTVSTVSHQTRIKTTYDANSNATKPPLHRRGRWTRESRPQRACHRSCSCDGPPAALDSVDFVVGVPGRRNPLRLETGPKFEHHERQS